MLTGSFYEQGAASSAQRTCFDIGIQLQYTCHDNIIVAANALQAMHHLGPGQHLQMLILQFMIICRHKTHCQIFGCMQLHIPSWG